MTTHTAATARTTAATLGPTDDLDRRREQRAALRLRHSQNLLRLMDERDDLHGVLPLADFVDESIRWTA